MRRRLRTYKKVAGQERGSYRDRYRRKDCGVLCSCQYKEIEKKAQKIVFDTIIANLHIEKNAVIMDELIKSLYSVGKTASQTTESLTKAILAIQKLSAENDEQVIEVKDEKDNEENNV